MFTGIITDIGHIKDIEYRGDLRVKISCSYVMEQIPLGASICCSGACLTVVSKAKNWFCVDVSKATLDATVLGEWEKGASINLEQSLKVGEELGGHLVTGHVDGVAELVAINKVGDSRKLQFKVPESLEKFIAEKGSVTLNGVSLTINEVNNNIREEINKQFASEKNTKSKTWENETEILDSIAESERLRNERLGIPIEEKEEISTGTIKIKKKKRYFLF